ncbi:acyl-CoA dehydrogenase C-terminal domain-containing protein [Temperatibacter marinus]|uniref:3-methylmercaptopropionyl-CoA dehydrogenase n=1 Tax=Temperatibacter marinus TaxID=1456591 RepID=A0AA52EFP9_9PROT|nr:acyl-CoA dehydrogenase C-terminal domain-containing protein [Temperatibacter marinus]WND03946.1 acyl-CoA dehydrogenase C-terminal domain-containing protein [Temperatibacter marinus]
MPRYTAPVKDALFIINEVLDLQSHVEDLPSYAEATPDLIAAILEESGKFVSNELAPLNLSGDEEGCTLLEDGTVKTPKGFKEAYQAYSEAGWPSLTQDPEFGGQGMPHAVGMIIEEFLVSANHGFAMYPGLSSGAMAAINIDGSQEQKEQYLPKMVEGSWTGTMNLTEPHCGTDLGMLRTKAEPNADGSYNITGTKIFISSGDHDMSENIIHLVLARMPDSPAGTKGISLFIVPKFHINDDGSIGERNGVSVGSLEEKMGIHANSTCVMNYDQATGYLIGEKNKGLNSMFIMMNAARIGVGIQGLALSEVSYQNALDYAKDRLQMRSLTGPKNPEGPADPIIVHPDVRRMLMNSKSFNEASRCLAVWCGHLVEMSHNSTNEKRREWADDIVGLLTPIIKGVMTDEGFDNCVNNQQVFGGHGYVKEWGMEQFVRDARIAQIYEGTNGIQALDLVGRKLGANGGRSIQRYFKSVQTLIAENKENDALKDFTVPLEAGIKDLQQATMWLMQNGMANPDNAGAGSVAYMHLFGRVILGHMWLWMASVVQPKIEASEGDTAFYKTKIKTGRYFMRRRMVETKSLLAELEAGCEDVMALHEDEF